MKWFICCTLCVYTYLSSAQLTPVTDSSWVDRFVQMLRTNQTLDSERKLHLADSAFHVSVEENNLCGQVRLKIIQATYLDNMGLADSALIQLYWANRMYQPICDSMILMALYGNFTNIFLSLGELDRIDSVSRIAIALWNPKWIDKDSRLAILNNFAIAQAYKGDRESATAVFYQALREAEEDNNANYIQKALLNLGTIKGIVGEIDSAYYFLSRASEIARTNNDNENYMSLIVNLANVDIERNNYNSAISLLDSVFILADTLKNTEYMAQVQRARAIAYAGKENYLKAYEFLQSYTAIQEKNLSEERVKAVTEMMERYESEKKARQIQQLEIEKLDASLENERIKNARNRMTYVGLGVLVISIGLWSRLRYVRKSRAAIQKEKDISEGLLLNILPASVAEELKAKGFAEAKHYSTATILFSDFKSFTSVSEELNPAELVAEINICFKAFDEIMTKYGIEKIKTIGDAYMAAGGLPETTSGSPFEMVMAGIEMQRFIIARKKIRDAENLPAFEMRIGIHSGSVVAGIVGVKKFQYDIWGDTVNIASRMESSGEPGRVNLSDTTYQLVKDNQLLKFTPRGLVDAKGKGQMMMYFVDTVTTSGTLEIQN